MRIARCPLELTFLVAALCACTSATSASPPPAAGPPAAPPKKEGKPVENSDLAAYVKYLTSIGADGVNDAKEEPRWKFGGWHFFLRSTMPGDKRNAAAIGADGAIVNELPTATGWYRFFTDAKELAPADLAERVNWVLGNSGVASPAIISDKKAKKLVTPPALRTDKGGAVVFSFWQISPPNMSSPYLVEITAPPSGPAHTQFTHWAEVAKKK